MLIRSQHKEKIVVLENTCGISLRNYGEDGKYFVDAIFAGRTGTTLAIYFTEEKAIKVLDMIENAYYNFEYSKFLGCENDTFAGCIFQMPQDEEVKV